MDKTQAKFILQSFRPNGADATDVDFKLALQLAVEDRELGKWLVDERAADAGFSEALTGLEIPEDLRMNLLTIMHGESPDGPGLHEEMDSMFSGALSALQPPANLRDQVIAAMEMEKNNRKQGSVINVVPLPLRKKKWLNIAAIAATLILGVFFAMQLDIGSKDQVASLEVQLDAGRILNAEFTLDVKHESSSHLTSWLAGNNYPAPVTIADLPEGLQALPSLGCKKLLLAGNREASLICLLTKDEVPMHLIIMRNDLISDSDIPVRNKVTVSNCYHCPRTEWNVVRWRDSENTYILMSKAQREQKEDLLQYF